MKFQAYHLQARSPFHLGEGGVGVESGGVVLHADTLFAALCLGLRELRGVKRLEAFLEAFLAAGQEGRTPPLLLSSAFPFISLDGGQRLRFYPKPALSGFSGPDVTQRKTYKKIAFISETIFKKRLAQAQPDLSKYCDEDGKPALLQNKELWVSKDERGRLTTARREAEQHKLTAGQTDEELRWWQFEPVTRVALDRAAHASQVYNVGRVYFAPGCGLWFGIHWLDTEWQKDIQAVLEMLGHAGLGGERSAGHGQFDLLDPEEVALPDANGQLCVTLSPYHPTQTEFEALKNEQGQASYRLLLRRGWLGSPEGGGLRHSGVRMLAEGSRFPAGNRPFYGDLVEVTPERFKAQQNWHPVYRYGLAFPIGVNHA